MSPNALLPTRDQCLSLTNEQCRIIQEIQDPDGIRANRNWQLEHQPELIRLYMTMMSFPQIENAMRSKLDCVYKTYANRFRGWLFPVGRAEREATIVELYALVSGSNNVNPAEAPTVSQPRQFLPIRPMQPPPPQAQHPSLPTSVSPTFYFDTPPPVDEQDSSLQNRMSISTVSTWESSGAQSAYTHFDDTFSNPRFSVSTTGTSVSAGSQYSAPVRAQPDPQPQTQSRPLKAPNHDPIAGLWNDILRVIPCGKNHSRLMWYDAFPSCSVCGFSKWHALMVHARHMSLRDFVTAMQQLRDLVRVDFAGNYPIHFLMSAGVGMDYFIYLFQLSDSCGQNVFGQNPLHVLNPHDLGDQLISFLEWFRTRDNPPGLLLTQRDIYCRTPLHALLQHPLERSLYQKILKTFPHAVHQLHSLDTSGENAIKMMNESSLKIKPESPTDFGKIQMGITETKLFLSEAENQSGSIQRYGFHDIARGARGTPVFGLVDLFQCRICQSNAHSDSYLDQMKCARIHGRDCNAPDETGMTPAHLLVTQTRCNNNPQQSRETPSQTAQLFRILLPRNDPSLREALHVLDPEGNSLIFNIATRGFDEILEYALSLEEHSRRSSMVNACAKRIDGKEWSVLEAVQEKLKEIDERIQLMAQHLRNDRLTRRLCEEETRLKRCKHILKSAGAEVKPNITTRWKICV